MIITIIIIGIVVLLTNLVNIGVDFKDYEKLKINDVASIELFKLARDYSSNFDLGEDMIDDICDVLYGDLLSKYINDKNINDIQLNKRTYGHDY